MFNKIGENPFLLFIYSFIRSFIYILLFLLIISIANWSHWNCFCRQINSTTRRSSSQASLNLIKYIESGNIPERPVEVSNHLNSIVRNINKDVVDRSNWWSSSSYIQLFMKGAKRIINNISESITVQIIRYAHWTLCKFINIKYYFYFVLFVESKNNRQSCIKEYLWLLLISIG